MKSDRPGEELWQEWVGEDYDADSDVVYVTYGEVDTGSELARKALAYALQRDGVADSVGDGFSLTSDAVTVHGYSGILPGEGHRVPCGKDGVTIFGDSVEADTINVTHWVEISI